MTIPTTATPSLILLLHGPITQHVNMAYLLVENVTNLKKHYSFFLYTFAIRESYIIFITLSATIDCFQLIQQGV